MADRFDKSTELATNPKTLLASLSCGIVALDAAGAVLYVTVAGALLRPSPRAAARQPVFRPSASYPHRCCTRESSPWVSPTET